MNAPTIHATRTAVSVTGLRKAYRDRVVLDGVDLHIGERAPRVPPAARTVGRLLAARNGRLVRYRRRAFVAAVAMPAALRWLAEHQPFTPVVESLRALLAGRPAGTTVRIALAWCAAIALVGYLWARTAFRRGTR
jgi:hypothetical protein